MRNDAKYLIVNADDFGYFRCVTEGILEAHRKGIVTATGILANGHVFERDRDLIAAAEGIDFGVHLNLTEGRPLTESVRRCFASHNSRFAGKMVFLKIYLAGRLPISHVVAEWRAQIEECLKFGLSLKFLNSHEHLHMLPALFDVTRNLAAEYGIPFVRLSAPERILSLRSSRLVRDGALKLMDLRNSARTKTPSPYFLGMAHSGALSREHLGVLLESLKPGRVYELMCHPGRFDSREVTRKDLLDYHSWELELRALCCGEIRSRLRQLNIKLVRFSDLENGAIAGRLRIDPAP
jgi:predicted glycoside hydrolase/deacetylase ChbG (UPF0249 family)